MFTYRSYLLALCLVCAHVPAAFGSEWADQFQSGPFVFRAEFPIERDGWIVRELHQLHADIGQMLKIKVGNKPVEVYLFRDRSSYVRYVAPRVPEGTGRRALYAKTDGVSRVYAYYSRELPVDLRHECTHALVHNTLDFIPLWLDEGLAEYFEIARQQRIRPERMRLLAYKNRFTWRPSFKRLESLRDLRQMNGDDYLQSWAWVHFLLHESPQSRQVLLEYLSRIEQSDPPGPLSGYVSDGVPDHVGRLRKHFAKWGRVARK